MTIEEWAIDFKSYVNELVMPRDDYKGIMEYIDDALTLLKEHEAELSYREAKPITHTATKLDDATCPSCGNVVGEKIRTGTIGQPVVQVQWDYCRFCGQKLNWEGL